MASIEYPPTKAHRIRLAQAFGHVPRVDLSIECAVEGQMGKAFVDDVEDPTVFRIEVGPFFYLAGDAGGPAGREMLESLAPYTLLMTSSPGWIEAAREMYGERLTGFDRYSFSSESVSAQHLERLVRESPFAEEVRRMDLSFVSSLWGVDHFIDLSDFGSPEDFVQRGVGFYVEVNGEVVGGAFSSLVCAEGIEVSLFVCEDHRRQGIGTALAGRLVKWSVDNNARANWDAANPESCRLAEKLGYTPRGQYTAYYLKTRED